MVDHNARGGRPGGFTLIELLIVIAIIMIMLSLLLPFLSLFDTAKDAATKERIRNVTIALQANLGSERALDEVQDMLLPEVVRWDSLRAVLSAVRAYGVDLTDLAYIQDDLLYEDQSENDNRLQENESQDQSQNEPHNKSQSEPERNSRQRGRSR